MGIGVREYALTVCVCCQPIDGVLLQFRVLLAHGEGRLGVMLLPMLRPRLASVPAAIPGGESKWVSSQSASRGSGDR